MVRSPRKIIYVDDVIFHLVSVKERLSGKYEICPAQSASEMFKLLEHINQPELILLDINMPDIDGFEAIKRLKEDPMYAKIPVIFLTSSDDKQSILKGLSLGAVDFVKKPFSDTELIDCIEYQLDPKKREENKPIVLAIDDDPGTLKSINFLVNNKYTVYTLNDPTKLKTLLTMITPDLFLLDCLMPGLTGFDLIPVIREHHKHTETPIIFLTSDGTVDNMSAAVTLGASDFVVKPIEEEILHEKLSLHLKDFIMRRRFRVLMK